MRWGSFSAATTTATNSTDPGNPATSNTGELEWDRTRGILRVDNPWWQGAVGHLAAGASTTRMGVSGITTTAGRDFAAIHLVSGDSLPIGTTRHMLLLTSARLENQHQVWNASFNALTTVFATGDTTVCEPVTGRVAILVGRTDSVSVWTLDARGTRVSALPLGRSGDSLVIALPGTTLWYEVALGDASSTITGILPRSRTAPRLSMRHSGRSWIATWSVPGGAGALRAEFEVRDAAGRNLSHETVPVDPAGSRRIAAPTGSGMAFARVRLTRDGKVVASGVFRLAGGF
jgi:hypothetical protein